jgi:hypothetical protein
MATGYNPTQAAAVQRAAAQRRAAAVNQGPADQAQARNIREAVAAGEPDIYVRNSSGQPVMGPADIRGNRQPIVNTNYATQRQVSTINSLAQGIANQAQQRQLSPVRPASSGSTSSGGGSRGGGGGGGGRAAAPVMSQAMIDWLAQLMRSGAPQAQTASTLDLPDFTQQAYRDFDPTLFNQNRTALAGAQQQDLGTINQSHQDLLNFLTSNYRNAYANADLSGGPLMGTSGTDMARMLAGQGVTGTTQGQQGVADEAARAQSMAGDWRQALSANEDQAQRNRLTNANTSQTQQQLALSALGRTLGLGIDQSQTQAQSAWQTAADQWNEQQRELQYNTQMQEAMQNYQRQNQVQDLNTQNTAAYRNQVLQAMLGLANSNVGNAGITLPDMASLGLG